LNTLRTAPWLHDNRLRGTTTPISPSTNAILAFCRSRHVGGALHPTHRARTNSTRHRASRDEGIFASLGVAIIGCGCIAVVALPLMALEIKLVDKACCVDTILTFRWQLLVAVRAIIYIVRSCSGAEATDIRLATACREEVEPLATSFTFAIRLTCSRTRSDILATTAAA